MLVSIRKARFGFLRFGGGDMKPSFIGILFFSILWLALPPALQAQDLVVSDTL
jgi:hypothetical protein